MINNCIFCKIISNNHSNEVFWENEFFVAVLDIYPVNPGHFCLVPKRHIPNFDDLNSQEWSSLFQAIKKSKQKASQLNLRKSYQSLIDQSSSDLSKKFLTETLNKLKKVSKPDAYNYGVNDGKAAGRTIDHLHIHIIPRYKNDVKDPTGGVRYVVPKMGNYKKTS